MNYFLVKSQNNQPLLPPAINEGAHYYAFSPQLNLNDFTEAYTKITLPNNIVWQGNNGQSRNAYIAMGIASLNEGYSCDMGLCNWNDTGWYLCFGGIAAGNTVIKQNHPIPRETTNLIMIVKNDKTKDTKTKSCMTIFANFFNQYGQSLGNDTFSTLVQKCHWDRYYRFTSLLHMGNNSFSDGTRMMNTKFDDLFIYNKKKRKYEPWGIPTPYTENVWIVGYPNGSLWPYTDSSEVFNINNQSQQITQPTPTPSQPKPQKPHRPRPSQSHKWSNIFNHFKKY